MQEMEMWKRSFISAPVRPTVNIKFMEHRQTVERRAPQVGGQLFGVHLPIFNFKF